MRRTSGSKKEAADEKGATAAAAALDAFVGPPGPENGKPSMGAGYERIQSTLRTVDAEAMFDRLAQVSFGSPASGLEYGALVDSLDAAFANLYDASLLQGHAKVALEAFKADGEALQAALYEEALAELTRQKNAGERTKQVTDGDVRALMAQRHPEDVREHAERLARAKQMVEHFERLYDIWKLRTKALDTLVATRR